MNLEDKQLKRQYYADWDKFKKEVGQVRKSVPEDVIELLLDRGATYVVLTLADAQSEGAASKLNLPLSKLASLYGLEYIFSLQKEVDRLSKSMFFDFTLADLSCDDSMAHAFIDKQCQIQLRKKQELMMKAAEKVVKDLTKLKADLKKDNAPSVPVSNIVKFDYKGNPEVNTAYILSIR